MIKKSTTIILLWLFSSLFFLLNSGCFFFLNRSGSSRISPPPLLINSASGYFSFRLEKSGQVMRGRAFFLLAPGKGRIEILDPLGRLIFLVFWTDGEEYIVLPSEKAYWCGSLGRRRLMAELIDLPLEPVEILVWIVGQGKGVGPLAGELNLTWAISPDKEEPEKRGSWLINSDWQVEWDKTGKLKRGKKNELKIEIQEYFKDKGTAKILKFTRPPVSGRIAVLALDFNQSFSSENFQPGLIREKGYRAISWEEMKSLLRLY